MEKRGPYYIVCRNADWCSHCGKPCGMSSKNKMELPFDLAIPLLGLYLKNPESPIQKNLCTPMVIAALSTIAKCWKQPNCLSVKKWIINLWYIYTMEYYAPEGKKEFLPFATELDGTMLSEINKQ